MEKILALVTAEREAIEGAIIEYRFRNFDTHNAIVKSIIARNGVEMWEYIEASAIVQEETGLDMFEKFAPIRKPEEKQIYFHNYVEEPQWLTCAIEEAEADHFGL